MQDAIEGIAEDLILKGWSVQDSIFPHTLCTMLREDLIHLHQQDLLRKSHIGHGRKKQRAEDIRGDYIHWFDMAQPRPAVADYLGSAEHLYTALGRRMFQPFNGFEAHYAYYPIGSRYAKHLDRFRDSNDRVLSFVLYLNQGWKPGDGGELEVFSEADPKNLEAVVEPVFGRFVVFLSGNIFHAVRETKRPRYSVAAWVRHSKSVL